MQESARQLTGYVGELLTSRCAALGNGFLTSYSKTVAEAGNLSAAENSQPGCHNHHCRQRYDAWRNRRADCPLLQHREQWDAVCADPTFDSGRGVRVAALRARGGIISAVPRWRTSSSAVTSCRATTSSASRRCRPCAIPASTPTPTGSTSGAPITPAGTSFSDSASIGAWARSSPGHSSKSRWRPWPSDCRRSSWPASRPRCRDTAAYAASMADAGSGGLPGVEGISSAPRSRPGAPGVRCHAVRAQESIAGRRCEPGLHSRSHSAGPGGRVHQAEHQAGPCGKSRPIPR